MPYCDHDQYIDWANICTMCEAEELAAAPVRVQNFRQLSQERAANGGRVLNHTRGLTESEKRVSMASHVHYIPRS